MRRPTLLACTLLLLPIGCQDDPSPEPVPQASGFAEDVTGDPPGGSDTGVTPPPGSGPDDTADAADTASPAESGEPWAGTAFNGDIRGILTLTFTPAHALDRDDTVGMVGGYRTAEVGWIGAEDLYSPVAYQRAFPPPPDAPDTLAPAESLPVYDWGDDEDWLTAGNGIKLRATGGGPELLACLVGAGDYPLYSTSNAMGVAPECNPQATAWAPGAAYDAVLYGGELFEDNVLLDRVTTPAALTVTAPDLTRFNAGVAIDQDLSIAWEAGDDPEARIIIRVVDENSTVITVHAADDGEFTIPAAELAQLVAGPIDLSIARERTDRVQFTAGGLTILSRYERWGFFDLF